MVRAPPHVQARGVERLAKWQCDESIGQMKHANALTAHVFARHAVPNLQVLDIERAGKLGEHHDLQTQLGA